MSWRDDRALHPSIPYQPALDGLRGLAVAAVVVFHTHATWLPGGYVGVSVFFTLSGYLITALLLAETDRTGRVDFRAFYARRARRLLPASLTTVLAVAIAARENWFAGVPHLRGDLFAATFQVSNWTQLFRGGSYGDQLAARAGLASPLIHFWSLSLEEQYYWLWPIGLVLAVGFAKRRTLRISSILVSATMVSGVLAVFIAQVWGPNAAYWATPARAAEILAGAAVAALAFDRRLPTLHPAIPAIAGAVLLACCALFPSDHGPAYEGVLPVVGVLTAIVVTGLQGPGLSTRVLSIAPLRQLGRVSYGVYLYHWPIFVAFAERSNLHGPMLVTAELVTTLAAAVASYRFIESPIRRARWRTPLLFGGLAVASCAVVVVIAGVPTVAADYWATPAPLQAPVVEVDDRPLVATPSATTIMETRGTAASTTTDRATQPPLLPETTPPVPETTPPVPETAVPGRAAPVAPADPDVTAPQVSRPVRILLVGDSTAEATASGLLAWTHDNPTLATATIAASPGCGLLRGAIPQNDVERRLDTDCADVLDHRLPSLLRSFRPDVVVVLVTLVDHEPKDFGDGVVTALDPPYQQRLDQDYRAFLERVRTTFPTRVVFTRMPDVDPYWQSDDMAQGSDYPARDVLEAEQTTLANEQPSEVSTLDLRHWVASNSLDTVRAMRPDGLHWSAAASFEVCSRWLGPSIIDIATQR